MIDPTLRGLAALVVLGIAAQWFAWRLRLPSILLLIIAGFFAGPEFANLVDPDQMFGASLFPLVSCSVAIILFEGGLTLTYRELGEHAKVVRRLVTWGALLTWGLVSGAAWLFLGFHSELAVLLGAILVVTGPTVVGPLLRQVRPTGAAGPILKWEGIVIDPIGAVLAVLVLEAILHGGGSAITQTALMGVLKTVFWGGLFGALGAWVLVMLLRRYWVPDSLHNPVALAIVLLAFAAANAKAEEAGLLSVTLMGVALANQKAVPIRHILEFKENLRVLLISSLFILMAARLRVADLQQLDAGLVGFLLVLILIIRPLVVFACTWRTGLKNNERALIAWLAPRGIVAASVASVFAFRIEQHGGAAEAARLVPVTFLTVIATVSVYGLTAGPVARWLGLSTANPQGALIVGAHPFARMLALALQNAGVRVVIADTNAGAISAARMAGLPVYLGNVLADHAEEELDLQGVGRLLALTANDEVNALCAAHYRHLFGSEKVFQISQGEIARGVEPLPAHLSGRYLFDEEVRYADLQKRYANGEVVKATKLSEQFDFAAWRELYGADALPLAILDESGTLTLAAQNRVLEPKAGHTLLAFVKEPKETEA
ncbi:MAG: sodium:proton antiporter [Planctomycetota bacterium]